MKKIGAVIIGIACMATFAFASPISIGPGAFTYTQDFSALGTGTVAWVDDSTIQGVYLNTQNSGIPTTVMATVGSNDTSGVAYNMGLNGDPDRALGFFTKGGPAYVGIQFKDQTGNDGHTNLTINYSFVLEQWSDRNTVVQSNPFKLEYRVNSSAQTNNLIGGTWIALGEAVTPVVGDGAAPYELNGNLYQFTISGTATIDIHHGQTLSFRYTDPDPTGADAMVGIDSITLEVIPEPATIGLFMISGIGAIVLRRITR